MKLFVFLVNYKVGLDKVDEHLAAHRSYLQNGYKNGILLASGPRNPRNGGLIIGKFANLQAAKDFSKDDPFCINNIANYEIFEFEPVLHSEILKDFLQS